MSTSTIHLHPETPAEREGWVRLAARVEGLTGKVRSPDTLWFETEAGRASALSELADPLVLGILFAALHARAPVHVHGDVSRTLLANLEAFQAIWHSWRPRYEPVAITADREVRSARSSEETAILFSGGLDSSYSLYRHHRGLLGRRSRRITAGLMVHGFDIPLESPEAFASAAEDARRMLASLDLPLWQVRTNFRAFRANWHFAHGAGLAACLHLFAGALGVGLISSTVPTTHLQFGVGSHALTDPLLSSDRLTVVHDGAEVGREERPPVVAAWPEAMRRLRVCWEGEKLDRNCGACPKCVLTKMAFLAHRLPLPETLEPPPSVAEIRALPLVEAWEPVYVRLILGVAARNRLRDEARFRALATRVRPSLRQRLAIRLAGGET